MTTHLTTWSVFFIHAYKSPKKFGCTFNILFLRKTCYRRMYYEPLFLVITGVNKVRSAINDEHNGRRHTFIESMRYTSYSIFFQATFYMFLYMCSSSFPLLLELNVFIFKPIQT